MKTTFRIAFALLLSLSLYLSLIPGAYADSFYTVGDMETFDSGDAPGPFTVYFSSNGGYGTLTSPVTKAKGETMILPTYGDVYLQNHTLIGWNNDPNGNGTHYDPGAIYTFYEDETLYAEWDIRITYYANSSEAVGGPMVATAVSGDYVTLSRNEYSRPDYQFIGWNTRADGYGTTYSDGQTIKTPSYDMKLYAQWERNAYTIKFDANRNGGTSSGTMKDLLFITETDTNKTLTKNSFTNLKIDGGSRIAFSFMGWNTEKDGTGDDYADEGTITKAEITALANSSGVVNLYAQWATAIVFDGNGATSGSMPPQEFTIKETPETIPINENRFVRTNYKFSSWNTEADGSGTTYPNKSGYLANTGITLYAQWDRTAYAVSYDPNGGGGTMADDNVDVGQSVNLKNSTFTPEPGKIFAYWKDTSGNTYAAGESYQPTDDVTMKAVWKKSVKVKYHPDVTDSTYKTVEIPENTATKVKYPTDDELDYTTPSGKTFAYWTDNPADGDTAKHYARGDLLKISEDIDLYAVYADTVVITYNPNGGTITVSKTTYTSANPLPLKAPKGESYTLYTAETLHLVRKGYEFLGWGNTASDESVDYVDGGKYVFNQDTELFAIWKKHTFDGSMTVVGSISGSTEKAYVNETLTATATDDHWKEFNYTWKRSDGKILGTGPEYTVQDDDFGHDIYCEATAVGDDSGTVRRSKVKSVVIEEEATPKRIVNNGQTEVDYVYGLLNTMYYTVDNGARKKVTLDSAGRFVVTEGGTYRFYKDETSTAVLARVEVENWYTIGYAMDGSGTVKLNLNGTTITSSTRFTGDTAGLIEYYPKMSGYTCWIVKEGANIGTFTLTVTPAAGFYAHVYLNEEAIDSFGTSSYSSSSSSSSSGTWPRTYTVNTPLEYDTQLTTSPGKVFRIVFNRTPPTSDIIAEIDETTFPDPIFRDIILERYDRDKDGKLIESEIYSTKTLSCPFEGINSLRGIEYFTELTTLYCTDNNLTELDLSACKSLTNLNCQGNYLTQLDLSNCTELRKLICSGNTLKALDVSSCPALASLDCSSNVLSQLTLQNNAALTTLNCSNNNLTNLDLAGNPALNSLICSGNALRQVTLAENTALVVLNCSGNLLSNLDIGDYSTFRNLRCSGNLLTDLDLSGAPALNNLECQGNRLNSLFAANCDALSTINCANNLLDQLSVSGCSVLKTLHCEQNQLTTLDLNNCDSLKTLFCYDNNISNLDLIDCPILVELVESREPVITGTWVTYGEMNEVYGGPVLRCDNIVELNARSSIEDLNPDLILPSSLTAIEDEAFSGGAFTYVVLPDGAESIGSRAFADCPKLAYIYIPASVKSIDENAFDGVEDLTIFGAPDSDASEYASLHGFAFKALQ